MSALEPKQEGIQVRPLRPEEVGIGWGDFTPPLRLTATGQVHFTGSATPCNFAFGRTVKTDEQPWQRILKVGSNWQQAFAGCWLAQASLIVLHHLEGQDLRRQPDTEQWRALQDLVIEIALAPSDSDLEKRDISEARPVFLLRPAESPRMQGGTFFAEPTDLLSVRVRCVGSTTARLMATAYPTNAIVDPSKQEKV